jgi:hypothetical protein
MLRGSPGSLRICPFRQLNISVLALASRLMFCGGRLVSFLHRISGSGLPSRAPTLSTEENNLAATGKA